MKRYAYFVRRNQSTEKSHEKLIQAVDLHADLRIQEVAMFKADGRIFHLLQRISDCLCHSDCLHSYFFGSFLSK